MGNVPLSTAFGSAAQLGTRKVAQSTHSSFRSNNNVALSQAQRKRRQREAFAQNPLVKDNVYSSSFALAGAGASMRKYNHSTERGTQKSTSLAGGRLEPLPPPRSKKGASVAHRGKAKRGTQGKVDVVMFPPTSQSMLGHPGSHSTHELGGYSQQDYLMNQNLNQTANTIEYPKTMQQKKDYIAMISQELAAAGRSKPEEPDFVTDSEILQRNYQGGPDGTHQDAYQTDQNAPGQRGPFRSINL